MSVELFGRKFFSYDKDKLLVGCKKDEAFLKDVCYKIVNFRNRLEGSNYTIKQLGDGKIRFVTGEWQSDYESWYDLALEVVNIYYLWNLVCMCNGTKFYGRSGYGVSYFKYSKTGVKGLFSFNDSCRLGFADIYCSMVVYDVYLDVFDKALKNPSKYPDFARYEDFKYLVGCLFYEVADSLYKSKEYGALCWLYGVEVDGRGKSIPKTTCKKFKSLFKSVGLGSKYLSARVVCKYDYIYLYLDGVRKCAINYNFRPMSVNEIYVDEFVSILRVLCEFKLDINDITVYASKEEVGYYSVSSKGDGSYNLVII